MGFRFQFIIYWMSFCRVRTRSECKSLLHYNLLIVVRVIRSDSLFFRVCVRVDESVHVCNSVFRVGVCCMCEKSLKWKSNIDSDFIEIQMNIFSFYQFSERNFPWRKQSFALESFDWHVTDRPIFHSLGRIIFDAKYSKFIENDLQ